MVLTHPLKVNFPKDTQRGYKATTSKGVGEKGKNMKTQIKEVAGKRFMTIDTGIPVANYREGITNLEVEVDKETGEYFQMEINKDAAVGEVSAFGVVANGEENGNFAIVIPVANDDTVEDIKKRYGAKMVKAAAGLEALKASMVAEAEAIDAICEGLEEEAETE